MKKQILVVLGLIFVVGMCSKVGAVKPAETKEEFLKTIRDNVNEILEDAIDSGNYEFLLTEAIPDIETEQELDIVSSVMNSRVNDMGTANKRKIDKVIDTTRQEIRKLAQAPIAEKKVANLGQALRAMAPKKI